MTIRESLLENLAGDLEYNPRRAVVYLSLGAAASSVWISAPTAHKLSLLPVVFGLGSLTLLVKGVFLIRKSSDGFGISTRGLAAPSEPSPRKDEVESLPFVTQMAQIIQDFGTGAFLLWPLLIVTEDMNRSPEDGIHLRVFLSGAVIFGLGWLARRFSTERSAMDR